MRAQLLHLSGPSRGRTVTYAVPLVTIGADPKCTAWLPAEQVAPQHARIEWVQDACAFHLHAADGRVFVNGNEVREVILSDEDEVEFGVDGPRARFRTYVPRGAVCKPVRRMLRDARAVAAASGGAAATTALTRDLLTQATLRLKIGVPLVVVAGAFLAGWLGGWLGGRSVAEAHRRTVDEVALTELAELRQLHEAQSARLAELAQGSETVRRIQHEWIRGVGLVHGVYRLRLPDGGWFSFGGPDPLEPEYTGTGFLATSAGHVITNRHVVAPWEEEAHLKLIIDAGARPEFVELTVTFPDRAPIAIPPTSIRLRDDRLDVAVVQVAATAVEGVPVLPLEEPDPAGGGPPDYERAIVVGYPVGLKPLLVRADEALVDQLRARRASMAEAIAALAAAGRIGPMINYGGVSNVEERMIVYDAPTTYGGSGGPVFGDRGVVIAVNFAVLPEFHGSNYGVPIRFARELLPK